MQCVGGVLGKAGMYVFYCVDLEQGRLGSRNVPLGPDEGAARYSGLKGIQESAWSLHSVVIAGVSEPIEDYCVFCVHLTPALPRCASHKHVFEWLTMHLQSGALARSEWDVPTAEPPLLDFYTAATVYSLHARSHLPSGMLTPALMHADACTATLCKPQARF